MMRFVQPHLLLLDPAIEMKPGAGTFSDEVGQQQGLHNFEYPPPSAAFYCSAMGASLLALSEGFSLTQRCIVFASSF